MRSRRLAYGRLLFILVGLMIAGSVVYWGGPLVVGENAVATRLIITVLATLNGFIIAIITIVGNPAVLYSRNWRIASAHRREIKRALVRYQFLFYVYLVTVILATASATFSSPQGFETVAHWLERITLGVAACAFFWSFALPTALVRTHDERLRDEVERRRSRPTEQNDRSISS